MVKLQKFLVVVIPVILAVSLVFSGQIYAQSTSNWPMYQYDSAHTGYADAAPPITSVEQLWNYTVDEAHSSAPTAPVVVAGNVYVAAGDLLSCFDASSGALVWSVSDLDYIDSSPLVAGSCLYVGSWAGNISCLDASNGSSLWTAPVGDEVYGSVNLADNRVYAENSAGEVYCLNASDGSQIWNFTTGAQVFQSSPAVSNGQVFVGNDDGAVFCLNAETGVEVWNFTAGNRVGSPAVAEGFVYFGSRDGNAYCLNASDGSKVWNYTTWFNSAGPSHGYYWGNEVSNPAVAYGNVYVGSSDFGVFCLNASTGDKVWNITTNGEVYAAPAVANGCVYVGSYDGNLYCLNATTGAENWNFAAGTFSTVNAAGTAGSPALMDDAVYVVGNGVLFALVSPAVPEFPQVGVVLVALAAVTVVVAATVGRRRRNGGHSSPL